MAKRLVFRPARRPGYKARCHREGTRQSESDLIANTSATPGAADVTLYFEDSTSVTRTFPLNPNSRFNVAVGIDFPEAVGRRFGAIVRSTGTPAAQIVVERAVYSNAFGIVWAAGSNALGTRLLP